MANYTGGMAVCPFYHGQEQAGQGGCCPDRFLQ